MKIYSFNVNGLRSVFQKGFPEWLKEEKPDIVCIQEIKVDAEALKDIDVNVDGYHFYSNSAEKKGYAGVAVYTRIEPNEVESKIGIKRFDNEGRSLKLIFDEFTLYNFYIPNGGRDKGSMEYKLDVYKYLLKLFKKIQKENIILTGDFNIAHTELDVYNAKANENNTMFTPEERKQIDKLIKLGYVDTFREKNPERIEFSWWGYRKGLRENDIGWRIDYFFVPKVMYKKIKSVFIRKDVVGSDHCPVGIEIESKMKAGKGPVHAEKTLF